MEITNHGDKFDGFSSEEIVEKALEITRSEDLARWLEKRRFVKRKRAEWIVNDEVQADVVEDEPPEPEDPMASKDPWETDAPQLTSYLPA